MICLMKYQTDKVPAWFTTSTAWDHLHIWRRAQDWCCWQNRKWKVHSYRGPIPSGRTCWWKNSSWWHRHLFYWTSWFEVTLWYHTSGSYSFQWNCQIQFGPLSSPLWSRDMGGNN